MCTKLLNFCMIPFEISLFFKPMSTTAMQLLTCCKACHDFELGVSFSGIDKFTAVGLVVRPVSEREAEADIVLIQTFLLSYGNYAVK